MRHLAAALGLALAVGCGRNTTEAGSNGDIAGSYALRSIGPDTLPIFMFYHVATRTRSELSGGSVALSPDSTWTERLDIRSTSPDSSTVLSRSYGGTYVRNGTAIVLDAGSLGVLRGTVVDRTMTLDHGVGGVYRYTR